MRVSIYTRISTKDGRQDADNQALQLREYCQRAGYTIVSEYSDHDSGGKADRVQLTALFSDASQRKFDCVLVWALDRFSREGARETLNYLNRLESYGVAFKSYTESYFDTSGIFREAIISIMACLAKQERIRIKERVHAGLSRAKAKGVRLGRQPLAPCELVPIIEARLKHPELSRRAIARLLRMNHATVNLTISRFEGRKIDIDGLPIEHLPD